MNNKIFTFELRSQFKELKVIFPLINTMLLNGSTCTVKVKSPNNTEFLESNKPMLFNLNYLERHISLQAYCHKDSLSKANEILETVFFPNEL